MITDQLVSFFPPGTNQAITSTAVNSNVVDVFGLGAGITGAAGNIITGTATTIGFDPDVGMVVPEIICAVGTAFTTSDSSTLTVAFQGAQDNAGSPGTYQTYMQTAAITAAQLTAGAFFARMKWPSEFPDGHNPRFFRLVFTPSATFTAGTVAYALVTMGPWQNFSKYAARNYTVAG